MAGERRVLTLGGKGSCLSPASVFEFTTANPPQILKIDPSVLARLSSSPPGHKLKSPSAPFKLQLTVPDYLTLVNWWISFSTSYDALVTEQLPEHESEMHEPKIMADPNDDISVIEEIPAQPKADVSEPNVNGHAEPEVVVDVAAQDDEVVNADSHEDPRLYQRSLSNCSDTAKHDGVFCGPSADHCTSELET
ncbi:hypothetical protein Tco_0456055, partial [Tanacetum coccineum]